MPKKTKTQEQPVNENEDLRARLEEAEETLRAIRSGEVDAIVVSDGGEEEIFTLKASRELLATANQSRLALLSVVEDQKQAEEKLRSSHEFLQSVEDALSAHIAILDHEGNIVHVNSGWRDFGTRNGFSHSDHGIGMNYLDVCDSAKGPDAEDAILVANAIREVRSGGKDEISVEYPCHAPHKQRWFVARITSFENNEQKWIVVAHENITERKEAEEQILSISRFPIENPSPVMRLGSDGGILYANDAGMHFLDFQIGQKVTDEWQKHVMEVLASGLMKEIEIDFAGRTFSCILIPTQETGYVNVYGRDVTERKQAGEQTRFQAALLDAVGQAVLATDAAGIITYVNRAAENLYGWRTEEAMGHPILDITVPQVSQTQAEEIMAALSRGESWSGEFLVQHRDGRVFPAQVHDSPVFNSENVMTGVIGVSSDITERKQTENTVKTQLDRLTALREIDRAINSTSNVHLSLGILLSQTISLLGIDACTVLLVNPVMNFLEYTAGLGFRTKIIENSQVRIGEGLAGRAALMRETVRVSDLGNAELHPDFIPLVREEGFVEYVGIPLIAKGKVVGVLESFQRSASSRDPEWLDFLESLAGQASIAIDNAQSFEGMQRSNMELVMAYDATIEGWSRAMDLRDKETEGHTQRVTGLTLKLAERIGLSAESKVQMQRGALLHDIGKLGVPDSILLKPGTLTPEEWEIMRRHPVHARDMLSTIVYLRPALDIPYCHHEKWDGTGYPQGLAGEQIPLAARVFAVADVWDALTSDRPYRSAWSREKTIEYLREQSGTHFDPRVVEAFLAMMEFGGID